MVLGIAVKIIVGMMGVLFFLRISGKTQMAQLTPLDSVNAFVLGALVGGVVYNPDLSVWYMVFALAVWTVVNMLIRYLLRFRVWRRLVKGGTAEPEGVQTQRVGDGAVPYASPGERDIFDVRCGGCPFRNER